MTWPADLRARFLALAEAGPRRDPGALLRLEVIRLLDEAEEHDLALYRAAVATYERMPPRQTEVAAPLRAAALAALAHADADLAAFEAVRLLDDADTMTAEPALTAVRVLGHLGLAHPLYGAVLRPSTPPDVAGEAVRWLIELPLVLARELLAEPSPAEPERDAVFVAGLVDLVLARPDVADLRPPLAALVARSSSVDAFRYAAMAAAAARDQELVEELASAEGGRDPRRAAIIAEARALF